MVKRRLNTIPFGPPDLSGRDDVANAEVEQILSILAEDHPARLAFKAGRPTAEIADLAKDQRDLQDPLKRSLIDCIRRSIARTPMMTRGTQDGRR